MEEITSIKRKLNTTENHIKLFTLSDLHIGSKECDLALIKKAINFIKDEEDCYCILLGDILDTALKNSKTDIYSETKSLADCQKLAVELLMPIKDKIIAMTPGNHENRVWKEVGVDLSLWLAEKLGLEDVYRNNGLAISIDFGSDINNKPFKLNIFAQHGSRGGRKLGSALNALEDLDTIVGNADIYIMGHTHQSIQGGRAMFNFTSQGNVTKKYKYYFNSSCPLAYGGYAYDKGYKPADNNMYYINVKGISHREGSRLNNTFSIDKIML